MIGFVAACWGIGPASAQPKAALGPSGARAVVIVKGLPIAWRRIQNSDISVVSIYEQADMGHPDASCLIISLLCPGQP